jgi:DNA polymerase I
VKPLILIDVSNLSYRNHHAMKMTLHKRPVLFGMLRDLGKLATIFGSRNFVFCFDSSTSAREKIYPLYKKNRIKNPDKPKIDREIAVLREEVLPSLGYVNILQHEGAEADDLIGHIMKTSTRDCIAVSNDSDLYQLIGGKNLMWNTHHKMTVTPEYIWTRHNIGPDEWVQFKALTGCKTDNIKGVPGVGEVYATEYIRGRSPIDHRISKLIDKHAVTVALNKRLVTLPFSVLHLPDFVFGKDSISPDSWCKTLIRFKLELLFNQYPR